MRRDLTLPLGVLIQPLLELVHRFWTTQRRCINATFAWTMTAVPIMPQGPLNNSITLAVRQTYH